MNSEMEQDTDAMPSTTDEMPKDAAGVEEMNAAPTTPNEDDDTMSKDSEGTTDMNTTE